MSVPGKPVNHMHLAERPGLRRPRAAFGTVTFRLQERLVQLRFNVLIVLTF
jgi:hypothetical protein